MEWPHRLILLERALAAALIAAALGAVVLESRSPLARAARAQKPWLFFLSQENRGNHSSVSPDSAVSPPLFLGVYDPRKPRLTLVYIPEDALFHGHKTPGRIYRQALKQKKSTRAAARGEASGVMNLLSSIPALQGLDPVFIKGFKNHNSPRRPELSALSWAQSPFWNLLARASGPGLIERILLAAKIQALAKNRLVTAWLPDNNNDRYDFFGRLMSGNEPAPPHGPITVEIFNAAGIPGLAYAAAKVLRSRGADVVGSNNAPPQSSGTVVYDRTGRIENAWAVRKMLDCGRADAMTRVDTQRLVDVSVVLSRDCAATERRKPWNSLKF
ncbi:MAG: LytR C-terminal domain-containing protein [Elusimicrobiota bacterium]